VARKRAKRRGARRRPRTTAPKRRPSPKRSPRRRVVRRPKKSKPKRTAAKRVKRAPPRPRRAATSAPRQAPPPAPPAEPAATVPVDLVPGSPDWVALDESVRRIESAFSLKFEDVHKRLDARDMRGQPFSRILEAVLQMTGVPEFYAWMIVRGYPGLDTDDPEAARLRRYLLSRRA
jgi:hypothetical protein